MKYIEFF